MKNIHKIEWECPDCRFKHDFKLEANSPKTIECPNCETTFYVKLEIFNLSIKGGANGNKKEG